MRKMKKLFIFTALFLFVAADKTGWRDPLNLPIEIQEKYHLNERHVENSGAFMHFPFFYSDFFNFYYFFRLRSITKRRPRMQHKYETSVWVFRRYVKGTN